MLWYRLLGGMLPVKREPNLLNDDSADVSGGTLVVLGLFQSMDRIVTGSPWTLAAASAAAFTSLCVLA